MQEDGAETVAILDEKRGRLQRVPKLPAHPPLRLAGLRGGSEQCAIEPSSFARFPGSFPLEILDRAHPALAAPTPLKERLQRLEAVKGVAFERTVRERHRRTDRRPKLHLERRMSPGPRHR